MAEALDSAEIEHEVRSIRPTSYFETELPDLPLTRLRDRTFEVLAHALTEAAITRCPRLFTKASLLREGADQGRDVLLLNGERVVGVIQCKRYSSAITLPMVLRELMRFALLAVRNRDLVPEADGFAYELWTAGEITSDAQAFFDAPQTWIEANRTLILDAARKARVGVVALSSENENLALGENEAALGLVRQFAISTVGPIAIKSRLADEDEVRRRFFRGPDDRPRRARASDVERLMADIRQGPMRRTGPVAHYVGRPTLHREFETFMASPARLFAVVGGSGQGKSTWADWLRDHSPPAARADVIRGEDIHASDQHVADTIARILKSRPLGGLASDDLVQAVLDWLDDASRLIVIDGIDRAPAAAIPTLHEWLNRTFAMANHGSTRFVVTSRQAAWALVAPDLHIGIGEYAHRPEGAATAGFPALELGLLSRDEAGAVYRAYGLMPPREQARFFRVPGLIAREAVIRSSPGVSVGPRIAVLSDILEDLRRQLQRNAQIGSQQFARLVELIGEALVETRDGRIDAVALRNRAPDTLAALDAALEAGVGVIDGDLIRIEPDDLLEYLMALRLDPERARALLNGHGSDLFIGGAALAAAGLEQVGDDSVRAAIEILRDGAGHDSPAMAAAARAITELRSKTLIREQLEALLRSWTLPNILLGNSPLVRLIDEADLPAAERLEAAMILAPGEDSWDWRGKYFYDSDMRNKRLITGFGRAAARVVAEDAEGALSFLLRLADEAEASAAGFDRHESVVSGLLYLAIDGAPALSARIAWAERSSSRRWLLDRVSNLQPAAVAELLGTILAPPDDRDAAIQHLWSMTYEPPAESRGDFEFQLAVAAAARAHLVSDVTNRQAVRLLVAGLMAGHDEADEARLAALWPDVDEEVFWSAMEVRTGDRVKLLAERVGGTAPIESRDWLLRMMPAELFSVEEWEGVTAVLEAAAKDGLGHAASIALESLLYRATAQGEIERLMPLARKFASSSEAEVRGPLTYFAGGPFSNREPAAGAAREELLDLLVEHECGENIDKLVWKVMQSATEFGSGLSRLGALCETCGSASVNREIARWRIGAQEGFDLLKNEWKALPRKNRPPLDAFKR